MPSCRLVVVALIASLSFAEASAVGPAKIFSDHMVFQRDSPVPVWGRANPDEQIVVEFAGQRAETLADDEGRWQLKLLPLQASANGRDLTVKSGDQVVTIRDVLVGEVWFAGGQSNMDQKMGSSAARLAEAKVLADSAAYPGIRFRKIGEKNSPKRLEDLSGGEWSVCSPQSVTRFSAAAFVFARRLHLELGVPIGVMDCSWGGTPIEPYIPFEAFVGHPTLTALAQLAQQGDMEGIRNLPGGTFVRSDAWLPGAIFNSRVAPVAAYAIRGAIWYQGESNCGKGEDPRDYEHKMRALIRGWREAWGQPMLPFYFVQLPQWKSYAWTYLREEQRRAMAIDYTGMAVTVDLDNGNDIHPANKIDVGERLALWPLAKVYNRSISFSGPLYRDCRIVGNAVEVRFEHVGDGLMAGVPGVTNVTESTDNTLFGFELVGGDGQWHDSVAEIHRHTVVVSSPHVEKPVAVRYACHPDAPRDRPWNLYNRAGLPASPFCSDWKQMPYDPNRNPR